MNLHRALALLAAWFLYTFSADALLSLIHESLLLFGFDASVLSLPRNLLAWIVVLWALFLFAAIFITPRIRKRTILPAVLFAIWATPLAAFPLALLDLPRLGFWVSFAQAAIAVVLLIAHRKKAPLVDSSRPAFSWWNLLAGAGVAALLIATFAISLTGSAVQAIEDSTAGFLRIRPSGLYLEERTFRKADKEVRLIAMIHIARDDFYDSVAASMEGDEPAVVLVEGVSDDQGLLQQGFSYSRLASLMGVASQEDSSLVRNALKSRESPDQKVVYRSGDIDISAFRPATVRVIQAFGALLNSQTLSEAIAKINDPQYPFHDDKTMEIALADITNLRNEHLFSAIEKTLGTSDLVIVPWGAMHMPYLADQLLDTGFREVDRKTRRAFAFTR